MLKLFRFSFVFLNSLYVINGLNNVLSQNNDDINNCVSKSVNLSNDNTNCKYSNESYHNTTNRQEENIFFSLQNANDFNRIVERIHFINYPMAILNSSNELCTKHSQIYLRELEKLTPWALKMYDSSAKIPSGILNGNINQFGDLDQCLDANSNDIKGQYCLVNVELTLPPNSNNKFKYILEHMHSYSFMRSTLDDPIHPMMGRFTIINWAVCTPSSCSPDDIERQIYSLFSKNINTSNINLRLKVDPNQCRTIKPSYIPTTSSLIAVLVFTTLFSVIILSTLMDMYNMFEKLENSIIKNVLLSFSLKRNVRILFSITESSPNEIKSLNGIRTVNSILIIIIHFSMYIASIAFSNRTTLYKDFINPIFIAVLLRTGTLYTDSFLFLSALLTTIAFLKELDRKNKIDWFKEYISRYMRIIPSIGAIILFTTLILPNLDSGPQWFRIIDKQADVCKKYWWRNLLFIQNYYGVNDMCLVFTHHVASEWQFFMVSPFLVWFLWKWPKRSIVLLIGLATVSTGLRYYVSFTRNVSYFYYYGIKFSDIITMSENSYFLAVHRLTAYIMGILFAYCLQRVGKNFKLKISHLILGWVIAIGCIYKAIFRFTNMIVYGYEYNVNDAVDFTAFSVIYWCLAIGWIIFVSHTSQEGYISSFLSWKWFVVYSRLSYSIYLTQFSVFSYFTASQLFPMEFNYRSFVNLNIVFAIALASIILTVTVEMPFNNLRSLFLRKVFDNRSALAKKS